MAVFSWTAFFVDISEAWINDSWGQNCRMFLYVDNSVNLACCPHVNFSVPHLPLSTGCQLHFQLAAVFYLLPWPVIMQELERCGPLLLFLFILFLLPYICSVFCSWEGIQDESFFWFISSSTSVGLKKNNWKSKLNMVLLLKSLQQLLKWSVHVLKTSVWLIFVAQCG